MSYIHLYIQSEAAIPMKNLHVLMTTENGLLPNLVYLQAAKEELHVMCRYISSGLNTHSLRK